MYAIVGSGFGLYGYLPALVEGLGETVLLPRAYEAKVRARPELLRTLSGIRWVDDAQTALARADAVVIAVPPHRQMEVVARCLALPGVERMVLEKPIAPSPALATELLARLQSTGKRVRIGYTMLHTGWHDALQWPLSGQTSGMASLGWTFTAHHFAQGRANWKRVHAEGGGVLRFFGIHVIALMARHGYDDVLHSRLDGESVAEPERWEAVFTGAGVPECRVRVDSRFAEKRFHIAVDEAGNVRTLVATADPFELEISEVGEDRRVGVLRRLLATFEADDRPFLDLYARVNSLWQRVEGA